MDASQFLTEEEEKNIFGLESYDDYDHHRIINHQKRKRNRVMNMMIFAYDIKTDSEKAKI